MLKRAFTVMAVAAALVFGSEHPVLGGLGGTLVSGPGLSRHLLSALLDPDLRSGPLQDALPARPELRALISLGEQRTCFHFPDPAKLEGRVCLAGLDLSSSTDVSAFVMLFPPKEPDRHEEKVADDGEGKNPGNRASRTRSWPTQTS